MATAANSVLLVLDDEPMIVRLITRSFRNEFAQILYAATPTEAEILLNTNRVTHFVCDANLGPDQPPGIELINRWHSMFPTIEKAVVFTGMAVDDVDAGPGIDIISKGDNPSVLLDYLKDSFQRVEASA